MPATRQQIVAPTITLQCSAAVAARRFVMHDAANAGQIMQSAAASRFLVGVSDQASSGGTGSTASVQVHTVPGGIYKVEVGTGGVTAGGQVASDATGKAVAFTDAGTGSAVKTIAGIAMSTAAAGELAEIFFSPRTGLA